MILLPAAVLLMARLHPDTARLKTADYNPDKFYLCGTTGTGYSYCFTYDPHEADAWMFRTAEGNFGGNNHVSR